MCHEARWLQQTHHATSCYFPSLKERWKRQTKMPTSSLAEATDMALDMSSYQISPKEQNEWIEDARKIMRLRATECSSSNDIPEEHHSYTRGGLDQGRLFAERADKMVSCT